MTPRILVVDDDPGVRRVLTRMLTEEGFEVAVAEDAASAIDAIAQQRPAVVVCDVHMPGPNGLWLADRIRAEAPATAIVLATGDAQIPPVESLRKGIVAYVLKPFHPAQVVEAVYDGIQWADEERRKQGRR